MVVWEDASIQIVKKRCKLGGQRVKFSLLTISPLTSLVNSQLRVQSL